MRRINSLLAVGALVFALSGAAGCVTSDPLTDAEITCDNWDYYLLNCTTNCEATSNCESRYWSFSDDVLDDLDWCSDCLSDDAYVGVCDDCSIGVDYCEDIIEDYLGSNCW